MTPSPRPSATTSPTRRRSSSSGFGPTRSPPRGPGPSRGSTGSGSPRGAPTAVWRAPLDAIGVARRGDVPLFGTCAGFQHVVLEYARRVLGCADAAHAEYDPSASLLFITALSCSLVGTTMVVHLQPGSRAALAYGATEAVERYYCNFGLNPVHEDRPRRRWPERDRSGRQRWRQSRRATSPSVLRRHALRSANLVDARGSAPPDRRLRRRRPGPRHPRYDHRPAELRPAPRPDPVAAATRRRA